MLYPDFKELIAFEAKSSGMKFSTKKKSAALMSGDYASAFKGQGMDFDEVREYKYGDDVRNIDWRVSARLSNTFIKVFKEEKERNVVICVDKNDYMNFGTRSTFKNVQAARAAAILAFSANFNKDRVGFYIFGNEKKKFIFEPPSENRTTIFRSLKYLSDGGDFGEKFNVDAALINLKRIKTNPNIVFIITDLMNASDSFFKNLIQVSKRSQYVVINIFDDFDYRLPDVGGIVFSYKDADFLANTSSKFGRDSYKNEFKRKQEFFQKSADTFGIKLININTSEDVLAKLQSTFRRFKV